MDFPLRARPLTDVDSQLFPSGCELNIELGSHHYKNYLNIEGWSPAVPGSGDLSPAPPERDDLDRHLRGRDLPIYLAKLELIHSAGGVFVGDGDQPSLPTRTMTGGGEDPGRGGRELNRDHLGAKLGILAKA